MFDHEDIIGLAQALGVKTSDLLALSLNNDPFYAELQHRRRAAEWFARLSGGFGSRYHIRRVHYILSNAAEPILKPGGGIYRNTYNNWKILLQASRDARYLGLVEIKAVVDNRNPTAIQNASFGEPEPLAISAASGSLWDIALPEELEPPSLWLTGFTAEQRYLIEIWTEKSGQNDVLRPLVSRYGANLINFDGESSEIGCRDALRRALEADRPLRILYLSDFDPGGRSMPVAAARKIEFWLRTNHPSLDATVDPIALLPEQVAHYRLPGIPMKESERRAGKFREDFGADATELDALEALHPGELRKIVERAILRHYDATLWTRVREARRPLEEAIAAAEAAVAERFAEQVQALQADLSATAEQVRELQSRIGEVWHEYRNALSDEAPSLGGAFIPQTQDESGQLTPLFDSKRDYLTQLDWYRQWQHRHKPNGGSP